jgi:molybdopterin synthase catalytic subunit
MEGDGKGYEDHVLDGFARRVRLYGMGVISMGCQLTYERLDIESLRLRAESPMAGAMVLFVGTTRRETEGRTTTSLTYECHAELALAELERLRLAAMERFALTHCEIAHRLGAVPIQEASIAIAVSSPHRPAAFSAAAWLMDQVKTKVPIWKCEHWQDGGAEWIHPSTSLPLPP